MFQKLAGNARRSVESSVNDLFGAASATVIDAGENGSSREHTRVNQIKWE